LKPVWFSIGENVIYGELKHCALLENFL